MEEETLTIRDKLFSVIRAGMSLDTEAPDLSDADCEELIRIGTQQAILPVICRGMKSCGAPEAWIAVCSRAQNRDLYQHIQREYALKQICKALDGDGIPYVLLKGAVLCRLYPAPELRTSIDIDILVYEEDLDRAVRALESGTDFRMRDKAYHNVSMINAHVHLELHFTIKENAEQIDSLLSRAWDYAQAAGEGSRYSFTPEFLAFHVIAHMCHHFLHGGLGVRPFLDLWLVRNRTVFDEDALRRMCSACGVLKFYEECGRLSDVWLKKEAHTETTRALEEYCFSGGVFGSSRFKNAGRQRKKRGFRYILSRVFPPAYEVEEFYRDETGKKHTLAYYYIKRLRSWFSKDRRDQLREDVQTVLSSDREYLDKTGWLFKQLEL